MCLPSDATFEGWRSASLRLGRSGKPGLVWDANRNVCGWRFRIVLRPVTAAWSCVVAVIGEFSTRGYAIMGKIAGVGLLLCPREGGWCGGCKRMRVSEIDFADGWYSGVFSWSARSTPGVAMVTGGSSVAYGISASCDFKALKRSVNPSPQSKIRCWLRAAWVEGDAGVGSFQQTPRSMIPQTLRIPRSNCAGGQHPLAHAPQAFAVETCRYVTALKESIQRARRPLGQT